MRSVILSFTALVALGVAPAFAQSSSAQMQQNDQMQMQGAPMGEMPAPPQHVPLVHHPTNLTSQDTRSIISPALPPPPVGPNADATAYLQAAQNAIARHHLGEAQSSLENAETYLLNRSVPMGAVNQPDQSPAVNNIQHALDALGHHDRQTAMSLIQRTIPLAQQHQMAAAQGSTMQPGMAPNGMNEPGAERGMAPPPPAMR